ncbi:glycosyltransferase [Microvirga lenta]|uniref:glycosyltransferase n=1 Tax=Microvirga lenta TaxID=2881337 RepID=UPI0021F54ED1|nr:glycosyltransferase [Microvirga lenta]
MPRVLAVIPGDENDRSSMVFARRQMSSLEKRGVKVRTFFLSSRTSPSEVFRELRRFRQAVKQFDPDVVHAHYGTMTALFCAMGSAHPLVISFRGSDLNPTSDIGFLRSLVGRLFSQVSVLRAKHVICVSQQLQDRLWARPCPTSIIFDGVDLSLFKPIPQLEARRKLGWSLDSKLVFFNLGGRPAGKRLSLAESAIDHARSAIPDIDLVPVSKVAPEQIPLYMNGCDCLLLTSDWEGSPTVVKEALACNLPVVSVDVGDVKELLAGVEPSRIVPSDPKVIGEAIIDVLKTGARSNGSTRAGDVSEENTTSRVLSIYQSLMPAR